MKNVKSSWLNGTKISLKKIKAILIVWLFNLFFAFFLASPALFLINAELNRSLYGYKVLPFDINWLSEMLYKHSASLEVVPGFIFTGIIIFSLVSVFISGGFTGRLLAAQEGVRLETFFADSGKHFWALLKLFIISGIFTLVILGVCSGVLSSLTRALTKNALTEWPVLIYSNLQLLILLILLSLLRMWFDYARIIIIQEKFKKVFRALRLSFSFIKENFLRAWLLYLSIVLVWLAGTILAAYLAKKFVHHGLTALFIGLVGMQVYMIFSVLIKSLFTTVQAEFMKSEIKYHGSG